jgi:hypothetical protein
MTPFDLPGFRLVVPTYPFKGQINERVPSLTLTLASITPGPTPLSSTFQTHDAPRKDPLICSGSIAEVSGLAPGAHSVPNLFNIKETGDRRLHGGDYSPIGKCFNL